LESVVSVLRLLLSHVPFVIIPALVYIFINFEQLRVSFSILRSLEFEIPLDLDITDVVKEKLDLRQHTYVSGSEFHADIAGTAVILIFGGNDAVES